MTSQFSSEIRNLARFRHALRKFQRLSDQAVSKAGLTAQQHQLLLGIAGFTGRDRVTISELADFLQIQHHSAVELVNRAEGQGLVSREVNDDDHRQVHVFLSGDGMRKLRMLGPLHRKELSGMRRILDLFRLERDNAANERLASRQMKGSKKRRD